MSTQSSKQYTKTTTDLWFSALFCASLHPSTELVVIPEICFSVHGVVTRTSKKEHPLPQANKGIRKWNLFSLRLLVFFPRGPCMKTISLLLAQRSYFFFVFDFLHSFCLCLCAWLSVTLPRFSFSMLPFHHTVGINSKHISWFIHMQRSKDTCIGRPS